MNTEYLAYVVYNLDDGHDFRSTGVFKNLDEAIKATHQEMIDNEDDELIPEMNGVDVVYKEYTRSYNIEEVKVYD